MHTYIHTPTYTFKQAPTNPSHFGTFLIFVCPGSSLKINFFASFWQDWRGGSIKTGRGGDNWANRPKI